VNARTRETWEARFTERAQAYWTAERTQALTGGKRLAVLPAEAPALLRALGLLDGDAAMPPQRVRKYLQINHLVRLVEPSFANLGELRILDAGCGRSYLTLLLAWCARERGVAVEVLGIDRDPDVIAECRRRTELAELDASVRFEVADLSTFDPRPFHPNAVVALHACDTATCDAIALGVAAAAEVIAVAPCCQAELARAWTALAERGEPGGFAPIWGAPHLRREIAADLTDAMRVVLLRAAGYEVTAAELVGHEHTKKNTLIRATRGMPDPGARSAYTALVDATGGCGLSLASRLAS
jgi:SAM-dependent methyltransferase